MLRRLATMMCFAASSISGGQALADEAIDSVIHDAMAQLTPVTHNDLARERARGTDETPTMGEVNVQISDVNQKAVLKDNVVESSITGSNTVSNGAFAGASGLATVIQNSGNNVIIQDATIVNYTVHQ